MIRKLVIAVMLFACMQTVSAQGLTAVQFTQYTSEAGLSDNYVAGITEDSTGFLWITTKWGLNRFDGHNFLQYHTGDDSLALPAEELTGINWLDDHRFAVIGTGIHVVDTRTGERRNVFVPYEDAKYEFKFNMTLQAAGDVNGNLFVISRSGFYHFDKQYQLVSRFDYYPKEQIPLRHLVFGSKILFIDPSHLLITSIAGLFVYDINKKSFRHLKEGDYPLLDSYINVRPDRSEFFQLSPGKFLITDIKENTWTFLDLTKRMSVTTKLESISLLTHTGWRSKLLQVSKEDFLFTSQQAGIFRIRINPETGDGFDMSTQPELAEYTFNDISYDRHKRLLLATRKGFFRQQSQRIKVESSSVDAGSNFPRSAFDDVVPLGSKVYAGTYGSGLAVFDRKTMKFEKTISVSDSKPGANMIRALQLLPDQTLFIGNGQTPSIFNPSTNSIRAIDLPDWSIDYDWVLDAQTDRRGNLWIAGRNTYQYNPESRIATIVPAFEKLLSAPSAMEEDKEGNMWLARHGLARFNTSTHQFDQYIDSFPSHKMSDLQVDALAIDNNNTIWLGIHSNGLIGYDPAKKTFKHFTTENGLPDNQVFSLYALDNQLWIATYVGIACLDFKTSVITNFGKQDGFPQSAVNRRSHFFYDSTAHLLYLGLNDAIVRFDPASVSETPAAPSVFIESVTINGNEVHYLPTGALSASWNDRQFTVNIGTINFFDGNTQRYAYRMADDRNMEWIELGSGNSFAISDLSPGKHHLEVKVYSHSNRWPAQIITLDIKVAKPFWLQGWFLCLLGVVLLTIIHFIVRWRSGVARKKEMVKTQIEKLRAEDYKSQFELEQITHYFSSSLAGKKTEEDVLNDVTANLIGRMQYEDCIIYLWNEGKTGMVQKAGIGPKLANGALGRDNFEVSTGQGIVGTVMATEKPLLVNDTRKDERYRVDDSFRLSELAVPIIHDGELLGVIDSEHSKADYFSERDVQIMTTIATLIGNKLKELEAGRSLEATQHELSGINEQLAEARLSALQAQMNPHFVFNALNSIKRMILEEDNITASRYLSKFALMIRMTLEHSKETFVTVRDNIQYLKAYLDMERLRFDQNFSYIVQTADDVDINEVLLPSMMIQPLVENAIWHGLMPSTNDKKISVQFSQHDNRVTCTIEDNGIGIRASEQHKMQNRPMHRSVGLENLQKRIRIMNERNKTGCTLSIIDLKEAGLGECGTRVTLELNLITE